MIKVKLDESFDYNDPYEGGPVVKYYVWKDDSYANEDGFFDKYDAIDFAKEINADEVEETIWEDSYDYQHNNSADRFRTVWIKGQS